MTRSEAREEGLKRKLEDMGRRTAEAVKTCVRDIPDHAGRVCGKLADAVFEAPLAMGEVCRMIQVSVVDLSADCGEGWRRCLERV